MTYGGSHYIQAVQGKEHYDGIACNVSGYEKSRLYRTKSVRRVSSYLASEVLQIFSSDLLNLPPAC